MKKSALRVRLYSIYLCIVFAVLIIGVLILTADIGYKHKTGEFRLLPDLNMLEFPSSNYGDADFDEKLSAASAYFFSEHVYDSAATLFIEHGYSVCLITAMVYFVVRFVWGWRLKIWQMLMSLLASLFVLAARYAWTVVRAGTYGNRFAFRFDGFFKHGEAVVLFMSIVFLGLAVRVVKALPKNSQETQ